MAYGAIIVETKCTFFNNGIVKLRNSEKRIGGGDEKNIVVLL